MKSDAAFVEMSVVTGWPDDAPETAVLRTSSGRVDHGVQRGMSYTSFCSNALQSQKPVGRFAPQAER